NPASEFVEHFVGADRGLKRLSLGRVRDLELEQPVIVHIGDPAAEATQRLATSRDGHALVVDDAERPVGWIDAADLRSEPQVTEELATPGSPTLQPETTLRDALSAMLLSSVQLGVVVDGRDRVLGVISVDAISDALRAPVASANDGAGDGRPEVSAL
ncbi:MAG TPA: CBS domain-containing protein, partial [Candidatus Limnocylindria bacterium]